MKITKYTTVTYETEDKRAFSIEEEAIVHAAKLELDSIVNPAVGREAVIDKLVEKHIEVYFVFKALFDKISVA